LLLISCSAGYSILFSAPTRTIKNARKFTFVTFAASAIRH